MKLTRLCASGAKHYTVHELQQGMQVHVYTYMYIQTQKHFHLHSLTELEKSSQRLSPRTHLYMQTHVHMYMHVQCVSHMPTKVDLEYLHVHMELPFLPRHPSVYMSPVICPVETALILSAQTPSWASSQVGIQGQYMYIHILHVLQDNVAQIRMLLLGVPPPHFLVHVVVHEFSQDIRNKHGESTPALRHSLTYTAFRSWIISASKNGRPVASATILIHPNLAC